MTWHLKAWRSTVVITAAAWIASGCGSSGKSASIELTAPEKAAQLTLKDDLDTDRPGLQYDVRATASGVATGTPVLLIVEGETEASLGNVAKDGSILFDNVTLPPGKHTLQVTTGTGNVRSAEAYDYTFKTLVIDTPRDGAAIGFADDKDSAADGIQINVTASVYAVEPSEDIFLQVDGATVGRAVHADKGKVVFSTVTLSTGAHVLKAVTGSVESNSVRLSVNEGCATVKFVSPEAPAQGNKLIVGGGNSCPTGDADFTVNVVVATDAGEGRDVELKVNGATVRSAKVSGALARFSDVVLNHRTTANLLSVIVQGAQGVTCKEVPFAAEIFVDCDGSDCSIGSPDPVAGFDSQNNRVLYLNSSKAGANGFDVRVDTDAGALGKSVQLIIDRNDRNALKQAPMTVDSNVTALFAGVALSDGLHTVEARCEDGAGNVTYSGESSWVVDTKACTVTVREPAADITYVAADDVDAATGGVQVTVKSDVAGNDCSYARAKVCDASKGIAGVPLEPFDGNASLVSAVTLESGAQQALCVEIQDRAGNVSRSSVNVNYHGSAPVVQIESPSTNDSFNVAGNNGHKPDSDPSTPTTCNANFDVLCSELDVPVELHRGDASAPVIASTNCLAPDADSSPLPVGFKGRARLANVAFLPGGATAGTIVATQKIGSPQNTLTGTSSVDLTGACKTPRIDLAPGCPAAQIKLPSGGANVSISAIQASYSGEAALTPANTELTITGSATGVLNTSSSPAMTGRYLFTNVGLGNIEQTVTTQFTTTDPFDNTTIVSCMTDVVSDLPDLVVSSPGDGRVFGPGEGCNAGGADTYGIPVQIALDQTANRELAYTVGSAASVPITISGTSMSLCVPGAEGPNRISLRLSSTVSIGYDAVVFTANVRSVNLALPPSGGTLLAADDYCDPGFGAHIRATTDPIHAGGNATISNGTNTVTATIDGGGNIDSCLQLAQGPNLITISIDGTTASSQAQVTVIGAAPTHALPITTVTLPPANVYRTGKVQLAWAAPEQDWANQLQAYQLRCSGSSIQGSDPDPTKDAWWAAAETISLPLNFRPPSTSISVPFRIGEARNCVLRGIDAATQLTPIPDSKNVGYAFRAQPVDVTDLNKMGTTLARIGDVNGDDVDDILVGGTGRAYLYFGSAQGLASKSTPNQPDVTFIGATGQTGYEFGSRAVALGDFNGDGRNDFAIGFPSYTGSADRMGAMYVYYGRTSSDAWPTLIDVSTSCMADVCFLGEQAQERFGYAIAPVGDFNADGRPDFAVSAVARDVPGDSFGGRLYILLGHAYEVAGARAGSFRAVQVRVPADDPVGFYVDGAGSVTVGGVFNDAASSSQLGFAMAPTGNVDGIAGDDLLLSAVGVPGISAKLFFLSGRPHDGLAPKLKQMAYSGLQTRDTGTSNLYATQLTSLRSFLDTSDDGLPDVAVCLPTQDYFFVYLGDRNASSVRFASNTKITVQGESTTRFGTAIASSYNPNLSVPGTGDLDGDGLDEVIVGTLHAAADANTAGAAYLLYGDVSASKITSQVLSYASGSRVDPVPRNGTLRRTVQYVGDVTGDTAPDLVVADPDANNGTGGFTVLY
jgi:hypothetical protein